MNKLQCSKYCLSYYASEPAEGGSVMAQVILCLVLPFVVSASLLTMFGLNVPQALVIMFIPSLLSLMVSKMNFFLPYWLAVIIPAFLIDSAIWPFKVLYKRFMSTEIRSFRLLNDMIGGKIVKKKIEPQLLHSRASALTKSLLAGACVEFVRDQIGRNPMSVPIGFHVPRYERIELMNEKLKGKVAYVHFEVECRTKVGSNDFSSGAHFFARFELSADGMKIKKPDVVWVCDLECKNSTGLELAEGFARFIDERDGEDPLCVHDPREFMKAAALGLAKSAEDGVGSMSSPQNLESE